MALPKLLMQWKEPYAFSVKQRKTEPKRNYWPAILIFATYCATFTLLWFVMNKPIILTWLLGLHLFLLAALISIQLLVNYRVSTGVIVWNTNISRYSWGTPQTPKYTDLIEYCIESTPEYHVLHLATTKGDTIQIGMPMDIDRTMLEGILDLHGIKKQVH